MAIYGKQTIGASERDIEIDVCSRQIVLPGSEPIVAAYAYLKTNNGSTADVKVVLYSAADAIVYQSNQLTFNDDVGGWKTITWPATTPDAGTYKLAIGAGSIAGGANTVFIAFDTVAITTSLQEISNVLAGGQSTYPAFPNPIAWGAPNGIQDISLYLETLSGAIIGSAPTGRNRGRRAMALR